MLYNIALAVFVAILLAIAVIDAVDKKIPVMCLLPHALATLAWGKQLIL